MLVKDYVLNQSEFALLIELIGFWQHVHKPYFGSDRDAFLVDKLRQNLEVQNSIQVYRNVADRP